MKCHSGIVSLLLAWYSITGLTGQGKNSEFKITLKDQSSHVGLALSEELWLHSRIGALKIPMSSIERVIYGKGPQSLDQVRTRNRNLIHGIAHHPITLRSQETTSEFLAATIQTLEENSRRKGAPENEMSQYLLLRDGSMLSGRILSPSIPVRTGVQHGIIEISATESIRFGTDPREVTIYHKNGSERSGTIGIETIPFRLDLTGDLAISIWDIRDLYCREGFTPVSVQRAFSGGEAGTLAEAPSPPPFENLAWIPPGRFTLGSATHELGRGSDEGPQTEITLTQGFWMSKFEVTQAEYTALMGVNPSTFQRDPQYPVEKVSWHDALAFCREKNREAKEAGTLPQGMIFRLPTESEWEYACRAGSSTRFSYGDDLSHSNLIHYAWFVENSDSSPHPVGMLKPNPWGLHDMHGNVWEWCLDQWQYAYPGGKMTDYSAADDGWLRVARGGSWLYSAGNCRSANRDDYGPNNRCSDIGFRLVLAPARDR